MTREVKTQIPQGPVRVQASVQLEKVRYRDIYRKYTIYMLFSDIVN